jgi:oligopeptide transport system substrate-binding protein
MNKARNLKLQVIVCILSLVILSACGQAAPATPTATVTTVPTESPSPTSTVTPIHTNTNTPEPTAIPGVQVYSVSSLGNSIPWLPLEEGKEPMSVYYGFNVNKPPFNDVLVRQAFAAAIDREQIAQEAAGFKFRNVTPATSLTPPQTLGRDLYGEIGIAFNPSKAKDLLQQAGYTNVTSFPSVTLVVSTRGEAAPGAYFRMAQTIAGMWETHLGVRVEIEAFGNMGTYINRLQTNLPDMYQLGWGADYNDPDNFLKTLFRSDSEFNYGRFDNQEFDRLVDEAASTSNPAERQLLYIQAEEILTEQEVGVIPLYHTLYYQQP